MIKAHSMSDAGPVEKGWSAGDRVHCGRARSDGIVSQVGEFTIIVKVTATFGSSYVVGNEYAWLPTDLTRLDAPELS